MNKHDGKDVLINVVSALSVTAKGGTTEYLEVPLKHLKADLPLRIEELFPISRHGNTSKHTSILQMHSKVISRETSEA